MESTDSKRGSRKKSKSFSQRQLILDLVYRKVKVALRTSILDDDVAKTATETVRTCLQELALSDEFCNDLIPFPETIIPLPEKSFWNCGSITPFVCTFQSGQDCDYKPFKLDTIEGGHGLFVTYEIPTFPRVFGLETKRHAVKRRYSEFDELRRFLTREFKYRLLDERKVETHRVRLLLVPNLPPKSSLSLSSKFDPSFVYERSRALQFWIEYVSLHSLMQVCFPVNQFLSCVIKKVHTQNVLEKRAQKRLRDMRRKYASGGVAIVALRAGFVELQAHLNTSWQALRLCSKTQRKLDNARDQVGHSIIEFASMEKDVEWCETVSMFGVTLRNTFAPLDVRAFDPFKQCCRLYAKEIIPKMQKLVGDIASLSDATFEHDIENERVAVEWIEARNIRQTMLAKKAEALVHEQIKNAQNTIRVFKQLKIDIENWSNIETHSNVRHRYENMDSDTQERVKIARIHEALDAMHSDQTDDDEEEDVERRPFSSPFKSNVNMESWNNADMEPKGIVNIEPKSNVSMEPKSNANMEPKSVAKNIPPAGEPTSSAHSDNIGAKKSNFHSESKLSKDIKTAFMKIREGSAELQRKAREKKTATVVTQHPSEKNINDEHWIQAETEDGLIYFYHPVTRVTRWDKPDKIIQVRMEEEDRIANRRKEEESKRIREDKHEEASKPNNNEKEEIDMKDNNDFTEHWVQAETEDGLVYYYHPITRATRWDKPDKQMQMKIEKRIRATKHEERKRHEERVRELEHSRKEVMVMESMRTEIDREIQRSISLWKKSLVKNDLAEMLSRLPGIIKLDLEEFTDSTALDASVLRNDSKRLKKLYRKVLMRVHPDKIRPTASLRQARLKTFVFTTLSAAAEGLF